jgi:anthranilate 1,2-dioxygenase small subunit
MPQADQPAGQPLLDPLMRARISDLMVDYAHAIDDENIEAWPGFFTQDALYQITTRENHQAGMPIGIMLCQGIGMIEDRVLALRKANVFEPHHYNHILSRSRIDQLGEGLYDARTNFQITRIMQNGDTTAFATGTYLDRIVEIDGALKLRERRAILDSRRVDVLLVWPL